MRLRSARIVPFRLPLRKPSGDGGMPPVREGFLLELVGDEGLTGIGEGSPAAWVGGESLDSTRRDLERIVRMVREGVTTVDLARHVERGVPSPAAACALDTALLDLGSRARGVTAASLLGHEPGTVPLAALVTGRTVDDVHHAARAAAASGYRTLKLKVGGLEPSVDRERIHAAVGAGPGIRIRLDANRQWSPEKAGAALSGLSTDAIDFVEEPLEGADPDELARLRERTGLPIALDESLAGIDDLEGRAASSVDVVVVKACRCGGPSAALALADRALERGLGVAFTDSIETSVGASLTVHLAAALHEPRRAVGLGGPQLLAGDVVRDPIVPSPEVHPRGPGLGVTLNREITHA